MNPSTPARHVPGTTTVAALCMLVLALASGTAQNAFYLMGTIPSRDPAASASLLDLSGHYTAPLDNDWLVSPGVNLGSLPKGIQRFTGVQFDVRGIVQLASTELLSQSTLTDEEKARQYPRAVEGIPVRLKAARIHFLQAAAWSAGNGEKVGEYVLHFADGRRLSVPLLYQQSLIDWWVKTAADKPTGAEVAWHGSHSKSRISLFKYTWTNPSPETVIDRMDFVSAMTKSAPFLVAASCEVVPSARARGKRDEDGMGGAGVVGVNDQEPGVLVEAGAFDQGVRTRARPLSSAPTQLLPQHGHASFQHRVLPA